MRDILSGHSGKLALLTIPMFTTNWDFFFSNYQAGIIYYFYFFIGSQAMSPEYVSSYGLIEQITELQDELQYLQHEVENVLPRERGRCTDEL